MTILLAATTPPSWHTWLSMRAHSWNHKDGIVSAMTYLIWAMTFLVLSGCDNHTNKIRVCLHAINLPRECGATMPLWVRGRDGNLAEGWEEGGWKWVEVGWWCVVECGWRRYLKLTREISTWFVVTLSENFEMHADKCPCCGVRFPPAGLYVTI